MAMMLWLYGSPENGNLLSKPGEVGKTPAREIGGMKIIRVERRKASQN